jgi:hypothetical protein
MMYEVSYICIMSLNQRLHNILFASHDWLDRNLKLILWIKRTFVISIIVYCKWINRLWKLKNAYCVISDDYNKAFEVVLMIPTLPVVQYYHNWFWLHYIIIIRVACLFSHYIVTSTYAITSLIIAHLFLFMNNSLS